MPIVEKNMKIPEYISRGLEKFDMILLFSNCKNEKLLKEFLKSNILKKSDKKILILSTVDVSDISNEKQEYHRISKEEQDAIEQLYRMYDFSNRFRVISDTAQYGNLLNYVKTGMMTAEEVFQALLA